VPLLDKTKFYIDLNSDLNANITREIKYWKQNSSYKIVHVRSG